MKLYLTSNAFNLLVALFSENWQNTQTHGDLWRIPSVNINSFRFYSSWYVFYTRFTGRSHNLMSLEELSELVKDSVEPLKHKAEQRLDELSVLMKETAQTLNNWDTETDETVTLIHNTRDEHVIHHFSSHSCSSMFTYRAPTPSNQECPKPYQLNTLIPNHNPITPPTINEKICGWNRKNNPWGLSHNVDGSVLQSS